jgi:hypothetical protein
LSRADVAGPWGCVCDLNGCGWGLVGEHAKEGERAQRVQRVQRADLPASDPGKADDVPEQDSRVIRPLLTCNNHRQAHC